MLMGEVLNNSRKRIPLKHLLSMTEYPRDMQNVLTLYAEGYSLADYLVQQGGKSNFLKFLQFAHDPRGPYRWDRALQRHYSFSNVDQLESQWNGWVMAGSPRFSKDQMLAGANTRGPAGMQPGTVVRSQSPDEAPAGQFAQAPRRTHPRGANLEFPDLRQRYPASRTGKPAVGPAQWIPIDGSGLRDSSGARYPQSTLERRFAPNQPSGQTRNTNQERNIPLPVTHRRSEKLSLPAARESHVSSGRFTYRLPLSGERITGDSASNSVTRLPSLSPPNE